MYIAAASLERLDLGHPDLVPTLQQPPVGRPRFPEQLIERPRPQRWLCQRPDAFGFVTGERLREGVARGREFSERQAVQFVDLRLEDHVAPKGLYFNP